MDDATIAVYDARAAKFADTWHAQPPDEDLHEAVRKFFRRGPSADIGCGSGRDAAWLNANGFPCVGYDVSEGLLGEARRRYPDIRFLTCALPALPGIAEASFDNVLCQTVIQHLPPGAVARAIERLLAILKTGGNLYLTWRITRNADQRDEHGRLYAALDIGSVRSALSGTTLLVDDQLNSTRSGKMNYRLVARKI